ncbi:CoA-binding domain protein [Halothermothrix orenii H 168]|uniref:Redox-sensing transcriptional repressor Rex n=1 Tax=Halothermothrix orenii (strain H 168 / OCM 544 / DSM 9562) TaxID=373903 RepID=B8D102_HALOH|nr:redox-sensing transcriptional repressor Rex [Halothermothrix orenii]ACL68971.1 CoA-binding domain protein [Halothermothrix orenii H 168]
MAQSKGRVKSQGIPVGVINRLPHYYRYLSSLMARDVERISSRELASKLGVTASQIRQDLSYFGCFGQPGYGYRVQELQAEIGKILGVNENMHMVLVGAGNLGMALMKYPNFRRRGFYIRAIFDSDINKIGQEVEGIEIKPVSELEKYLSRFNVDIGIIATPAGAAPEIASIFMNGGVKGIWNFAPVSLNPEEGVVIENVHISESLMTLSYKVKEKDK